MADDSLFFVCRFPIEEYGTVFPALYPPIAGLLFIPSWQTLAGTRLQ